MEITHFYVLGRVQGVGYRAWAVRTARQLNIEGWVRNRTNGSVEIYAQGESVALSTFRQMCLKGPLWSRVEKLDPVTQPTAFVPPVEPGVFQQQGTV